MNQAKGTLHVPLQEESPSSTWTLTDFENTSLQLVYKNTEYKNRLERSTMGEDTEEILQV